ncbi:MAG: porphobilinogen synthase [Thermoplasmatota archaeon]
MPLLDEPVVQPSHRLRRLRRTPALRSLVQETRVHAASLVQPLFVQEGLSKRRPIPSMPGVERLGLADVAGEAQELVDARVGAVMLFGLPKHKDATGTGAYDEKGIVQQAIQRIKQTAPELVVIADACLCEYTDHGHCGPLGGGEVDNDATLRLLAKTAVSQAKAGADIVAPSAMMDGQVAAIRSALDAASFALTPILSYAAKHASALYGPFRDAAGSAPHAGDRRGYQMNPANGREAMREIQADLDEGADMVLVKPALSCLDLIRQARDRFDVPIGAYQVSGEYAMIKAAATNGWLDESRVVAETLQAIRRAGAGFTITYFAKQYAQSLGAD